MAESDRSIIICRRLITSDFCRLCLEELKKCGIGTGLLTYIMPAIIQD